MSDPNGYCNSCGEEMDEADDCCDDGEWTPYDDAPPARSHRLNGAAEPIQQEEHDERVN